MHIRPGYLLRRCNQIVSALFIELTNDIDITQIQYIVLRAIHKHPNNSLRNLAKLTAIDRTSVQSSILKMEKKELIKKNPNNQNKRQKIVKITSAGKLVLWQVEDRMDDLQIRILSALKESERSTFVNMLSKIVFNNNN